MILSESSICSITKLVLYGDEIMITYFNGTVFNTPAKALVNTVNTKGVMGAGIALEFSLRYPKMFKEYKERCDRAELSVGKIDYHKEDGIVIVNFPTKRHYRHDSKLEWIEDGLKHFISTYKEQGISSIAFPRLGCSNGHLDWKDVQPLMEKYLSNIDIMVYICLDNINNAEGKEKEMVDFFNKTTENDFVTKLRMKPEQVKTLVKKQPINRFWELNKVPEISSSAYKKLFRYFYKMENDDEYEQVTLF